MKVKIKKGVYMKKKSLKNEGKNKGATPFVNAYGVKVMSMKKLASESSTPNKNIVTKDGAVHVCDGK